MINHSYNSSTCNYYYYHYDGDHDNFWVLLMCSVNGTIYQVLLLTVISQLGNEDCLKIARKPVKKEFFTVLGTALIRGN